MGKRCSNQARHWPTASLTLFLSVSLIVNAVLPSTLLLVHAQISTGVGSIAPSTNWGVFFGTSGDVQININRTGIAVRVEIPREFLQGVISGENDTHFIQSDIRNDYYYYNVVDESNHWTYAWRGMPSDGACFKPNFSLRDSNAPWCVEIWNYLNGTFLNFTPPKFIRFRNLSAPAVAGIYNFTLFVANATNSLGYPDFVHAWNTTLFVPVSMSDDPASITGVICDADIQPPLACGPILNDKGVVYATNVNSGQVARAFVDQTTGRFNLTGLAPGGYVVQASAGLHNGLAYSLSSPQASPIQVSYGGHTDVGAIQLHRAPEVCGQITYEQSPGVPLAHPLSDHPYLKTVLGSAPGLRLNITVEATDAQGHVYRNITSSLDSGTDSFRIATGSNVTYVGTDPYGTEFAGLPPVTSGSYQLTLNVWITGFVQINSEIVIVSTTPGLSAPFLCNQVSPNPVTMEVGGIISGTIQLRNLVTLETPNQAKLALGLGAVPGPLFGGNILIQAYDHTGVLRGVVVNGTVPTLSGDVDSIRFYVLGFSEYANHTWSGVWDEKDSGLPSDSDYSLQVFIAGYEQGLTPPITVPQGGNATVTVPMIRGGAFQVTVQSADNVFGTRIVQAQLPFTFLNLAIPVRARIYFYDSSGRTVGFVERLMTTASNVTNGVGTNSFVVQFAGQNWSVREIWFFGFVPTHVTNDTYSIKGYTLGYVQLRPVSAPNYPTGFTPAVVTLLIANDIELTGPILDTPSLLSSIPEYDQVIGQVFGGTGLEGALPANVSAFVSTLTLSIFGFGAMTIVTCGSLVGCTKAFLGQGHFFYVSPDGSRYFDYGLDVGVYTAQVPEFGFNFHFMQIAAPPVVTFSGLFQEQGFVLGLVKMSLITLGPPNGLVVGAARNSIGGVIPLSWVQVTADNSTFTRSVTTLDGRYDGVGALFLPAGTYDVTFSVAFFQSQTAPGIAVQWGQQQSVPVPSGQLCPTGLSC